MESKFMDGGKRVGISLMVMGVLVGGFSMAGSVANADSKWSQAKIEKELAKVDKEKKRIAVEKKRIADEKKRLASEKKKISDEKKRVSAERNKVLSERRALLSDQKKLASSLKVLEREQSSLEMERDRLRDEGKEYSKVLGEYERLKKEVVLLKARIVELEAEVQACVAGDLPGDGGDVVEIAKNPLSGVSNYKIYYDAPTPELIEAMKGYDLVIVESNYYDAEMVDEIQESGTKVYGYISVMEAANWNQELMSKFDEGDFYKRDGERVHYAEWDSYLMDMGSEHYREVLLAETREQVIDKGFDGVFLDTVGDIDNEFWNNPEELARQRAGLVEYLEVLKNEEQISTIQNWGFDTLKSTSVDLVDGIMWEGFTKSVVGSDEWAQDRIAELKAFEASGQVEVLTVSTDRSEENDEYAKSQGFVHYTDKEGYNVW